MTQKNNHNKTTQKKNRTKNNKHTKNIKLNINKQQQINNNSKTTTNNKHIKYINDNNKANAKKGETQQQKAKTQTIKTIKSKQI